MYKRYFSFIKFLEVILKTHNHISFSLSCISIALVFFAAIPFTQLHSQESASSGRSNAAGKFALELDGTTCGFLRSIDGGAMVRDVIEGKTSSDALVKKHISNVKYEEISITCGTGMSEQFYKWIQDSFDRKYSRKNGSIIACDYNYKATSNINFQNALLTEVSFPACDASAKDPAYMTLKFKPEMTRFAKGDGSVVSDPSAQRGGQKKWLPCNFRVEIDGMEQACSRVNKIEAITIKQKVAGKEPTKLEIPNLKFVVPNSDIKPFQDWFNDAAKGKSNEKTGSLIYLAPDKKEELMTLNFEGLQIVSIKPMQGMKWLLEVRVDRIEMK